MLERWKALCWEKKVVYGGMVVLGLLILGGIASQAFALELNGVRKTRAVTGSGFTATAGDTVRISYAELGDSPRALPSAYMVWTPLGEAFSVRRFYEGTAEAVWTAVPEGQSYVLPAPPPYKIAGVWTHVLAFKGTVTDSILYQPMDR